MDLTGQTAVVTGAGSGIGKGIAAARLERGANVVGLEIEPANITAAGDELMSPAAGRITGHFVPVDGGQHVRGLHSYWDVAEAQGIVARPGR